MAESALTTGESFWALTENNEWEGEIWMVYFPVAEENRSKIERLEALLDAEGDESPYDLREIDALPVLTEADEDSGDWDEDEYWDEEDEDSEENGYFPGKSLGEVKLSKLTEAIEYFEAGGPQSDGDDPLYKLGLFR